MAWRPRSTEWVRRVRRVLTRRHADELWVEGARGAPRRRLWAGHNSPAAGIVSFEERVQPGAASGALVTVTVTRHELDTRRRDGQLHARVRLSYSGGGTWNVTPPGRRRDLRELDRTVRSVAAPVPDGGWIGDSFDRDDRGGVPVRMTPSGNVTRLLVAGRPVTPARMRSLLGEPPRAQRPMPSVEDLGTDSDRVRSLGYERTTNSAIVGYYDRIGLVIARVPLDGSPPSVVERASPLDSYIAW